MTGLWQVSGRSDISEQDRVRLDLYYVENWFDGSEPADPGQDGSDRGLPPRRLLTVAAQRSSARDITTR